MEEREEEARESQLALPDVEEETVAPERPTEAAPRIRHLHRALRSLRLVLTLSLCAVFGALLRIALQEFLVWRVDERNGVLPSALMANIVGSAIMGSLVPQKGYRFWHREDWLYTGLSSGFCGSLTTFSTWMTEAAEPWEDVDVVRYFFLLILELCSNICAFCFGWHAQDGVRAILLKTKLLKQSPQPQQPVTKNILTEREELDECRKMFVVAVVEVLLLLLVFAAVGILTGYFVSWRWLTLAAFFAPPGALLRFYLSLLNAKRPFSHTVPLFTMLVNVSGSIAAALLIILTGKEGWTDRTSDARAYVTEAVILGFLGSLTTVSTFTAELLQSHRTVFIRYVYGFATISISQVVIIILFTSLQTFPS
ncbi:CrcB-like protein-domain-containing protein [Balamuthia mandrillaris]